MRILYLTEFLSSIGGGGEVMFYDIARQMAKKGHKVAIICHESPEQDESSNDFTFPSLEGSITIHKIGPRVKLSHGYFPSLFHQGLYIANLMIKGSQLIRKNKIDLIHANTISPAFAGSVLGKLFNVPMVITVHHVYSLKHREYMSMKHQRSGFLSRLFSMPKFLCERMINGLPVDLIHTVSNSSKEDLIKFDAAKDGSEILMVPNGIDLGCYSEKETECQYQDFALFVGRLVEYKNLEVVIAAFSEVIKSLPTAQLVVVGDGPARPKLEKMVVSNKLSKNIKFMGYVSEENKAQLLRNCSMLVFPSLIEGFGLVILEAFAHRKPVLASDVKPINEIVKDKVNGLLIPPFDDSEWSKRILYLLNNKGVCKVMGWRGRFLVETKYELTRLSENIEAAYLKLVASRSMASDHANLYWYDGKTSTPTARSPV